jgi:hypothetical protein
MSIATHNLYDFIHQVLESKYWLIHFYPWGSRDLVNAIQHTSFVGANGVNPDWRVWEEIFPFDIGAESYPVYQPVVFCHDQEPLNFDLYADNSQYVTPLFTHLKENGRYHRVRPNSNLRHCFPESAQRRWVLLHSELNSPEVEKYNNHGGFACAYWWAHAIIAQDWFRFAKYDRSLQNQQPVDRLFLTYCRATTGSRTYRKSFLDMLKSNDILQHCRLTSNSNSPAISPESSATYDSNDFTETRVSVVLETVCENKRIHLTEKTIRPIACGHPFILVAGPGSLAYLRKYGFQTFSPFINESYDLEPDPTLRMQLIAKEMQRLSNLPSVELSNIVGQCKEIARYNQELFFSDGFTNQVIQELKDNVFSINLNDQMFIPEFDRRYDKHLPEIAKHLKFYIEQVNGFHPTLRRGR